MKPLIIMITFNRLTETKITLESLLETGAFGEAQVVIYDNGSTDGTWKWLGALPIELGPKLGEDAVGHVIYRSAANIGCPRALNVVMYKHRQPGQAVIKVDNDVRLLTPGWVGKLAAFAETHPEAALIGPWYKGMTDGRRMVEHDGYIEIFPLMGHCVYHAGHFLDQVGYFDVLADDHLYGFEDLLMCHRAVALGYKCVALPEIRIENIQRKNALDCVEGEGREAHVARMRPLYNSRVAAIRRGETCYVGPNGKPEELCHSDL